MEHPMFEHNILDLGDGRGFNYNIRLSTRQDLVATIHFDKLSDCVGKQGGFKESVAALEKVYEESGVQFPKGLSFPR